MSKPRQQIKVDTGHEDIICTYELQRSKSSKRHSNYETVTTSNSWNSIEILYRARAGMSSRRYRVLKHSYIYKEVINQDGLLELVYKLARTQLIARAGG